MNKKNTPPYKESHTSETDMAHAKRQPPHVMGYGDGEGHSSFPETQSQRLATLQHPQGEIAYA